MTPKKQRPCQRDHLQEQIYCLAEGIVFLSGFNLSPVVKVCLHTFTGTARDTHPPSTYEDQLIQMFADMKEEMAKQHALFDRESEQATLDRENAARERELEHLKDQLLAQITALQSIQGPPPLAEGPTATEAQVSEHT